MQEITRLPRMRTTKEATAELKAMDPQTAVTEHYIRQLVHNGTLPIIKAGKKHLINLNDLIEYLSNSTKTSNAIQDSNDKIQRIRRIG